MRRFKYIKDSYFKKSLDEPGVLLMSMLDFNFEHTAGSQEEFKRDKNNYLIIDRFATEFKDFDNYTFLYISENSKFKCTDYV